MDSSTPQPSICEWGRVAQLPLIDDAHLSAQTFGDDDLANELLALFREQCRTLLPGLADTALTSEHRADLAHTLKGSALGIGAVRVAQDAGHAEEALRSGVSTGDLLDDLERAVRDTLAIVEARLPS